MNLKEIFYNKKSLIIGATATGKSHLLREYLFEILKDDTMAEFIIFDPKVIELNDIDFSKHNFTYLTDIDKINSLLQNKVLDNSKNTYVFIDEIFEIINDNRDLILNFLKKNKNNLTFVATTLRTDINYFKEIIEHLDKIIAFETSTQKDMLDFIGEYKELEEYEFIVKDL